MYGLTRVALLATGVLSLDLRQRPLLGSSIHDSVAYGEKPLVTSEGLQGDISKDALLARAKHLYEIAELSFDEYNHPTRVIGSKGSLCNRSDKINAN
jgi:aminopeptidase Y